MGLAERVKNEYPSYDVRVSIRAVQIIVDSAGQTDYGEVKFVGEYAGAGKRTVAAYHHEGIDFVASDNIVGQLASFGCLEFHTTGRLEYGAALLYDVRHMSARHYRQ